MRTSPDPLQPLRTWRELWMSEPSHNELASRSQSSYRSRHWRRQKPGSIQWFDHLLSRDLQD